MKKKFFLVLCISFGLLIIFLLIVNFKYPFFTPKVGAWSVGYQMSEDPFSKRIPEPAHILTYEFIDSLSEASIDYIADPFFIKEKDTFYLFVELKGRGNANIALFTSRDGKSYDYNRIVLDEYFHLSYPQVFKYKEEFFMLPETQGANQVLLYKAKKFPYHWEIFDTLIKNKRFKDPSLLLDDELAIIITVNDDLEQFIFQADSLFGEWSETPYYEKRWGNETRPGGRFFKYEGEWFLPVQNRKFGYGSGISIYKLQLENKKIALIPEKPFFLKPQDDIKWFNRGMHHLDIQQHENNFYIVYDGDSKINEIEEFQYKRSLKLSYIELYNFLFNEN